MVTLRVNHQYKFINERPTECSSRGTLMFVVSLPSRAILVYFYRLSASRHTHTHTHGRNASHELCMWACVCVMHIYACAHNADGDFKHLNGFESFFTTPAGHEPPMRRIYITYDDDNVCVCVLLRTGTTESTLSQVMVGQTLLCHVRCAFHSPLLAYN